MLKPFLKTPQIFFAVALVIIIVFVLFFGGNSNQIHKVISSSVQINRTMDIQTQPGFLQRIVDATSSSSSSISSYSVWPVFSDFYKTTNDFVSVANNVYVDKSFISSECGVDLTLDNFEAEFTKWSADDDIVCGRYFKRFSRIYEIQFKMNSLAMNEKLKKRVREWLGNSDQLVNKSYNQVKPLGLLLLSPFLLGLTLIPRL